MTDAQTILHPGMPAPVSGQYLRRWPNGVGGIEVTVTKGEPLPPGPTPGCTYELVDATRHGEETDG